MKFKKKLNEIINLLELKKPYYTINVKGSCQYWSGLDNNNGITLKYSKKDCIRSLKFVCLTPQLWGVGKRIVKIRYNLLKFWGKQILFSVFFYCSNFTSLYPSKYKKNTDHLLNPLVSLLAFPNTLNLNIIINSF